MVVSRNIDFFQAIFFLVNHSSFFIRSIFDEVSTMDVVIEKIMVWIVLQGQLTGINILINCLFIPENRFILTGVC